MSMFRLKGPASKLAADGRSVGLDLPASGAVILSLLLAVCHPQVVRAAAELPVTVGNDRSNLVYRVGETVVFDVSVAGTNVLAGDVCVTLDNFGTQVVGRVAWNPATNRSLRVSGSLSEPGFLRMTLRADGYAEKIWSVAVDPGAIRKGSPSPEDFDSFWAEARRRLDREVPPDVRVERIAERSTADFDFYRLSFATFGRRVHGYMSVPTDGSKAPFPLRFNVAAAGFGGWTNDLTPRTDSVCVFFSVYPFEPHWNWKELGLDAKYRELNAQAKAACGVEHYALPGYDRSREDCFYYPVILGINRALDWAATRPDVDPGRVLYYGTSQGGAFGFWLCGLNRRITKAALFVPASVDTMGYRRGRMSGWPKPGENLSDRRADVERVAPYFDGANFASRIRCPIRIAVGFADTTCPPCGVYAGYNEIASPDKAILHGFGMGHGCFDELYRRLYAWLEDR